MRKVYSLSVPLDAIIKYHEEEKSRESAKTMKAIQRLKEIAATLSANQLFHQPF